MTYEENIMSQCITLAKKGYGKTFPNPMVGCIIVLLYIVLCIYCCYKKAKMIVDGKLR